MIAIHELESKYKRLSTKKLIELTQDAGNIRVDAIPVLRKELEARGETAAALSLDAAAVEFSLAELSLKEIQEIVTERLLSGESIESIKTDLQDRGVNITELLVAHGAQTEQALEYMAEAKHNNVDEATIAQKLQEDFNYDAHEIHALKNNVSSRAKVYQIIGYVVVSISVLGLITSLTAGGISFFQSGALLIMGIGLILKGRKQSKAVSVSSINSAGDSPG